MQNVPLQNDDRQTDDDENRRDNGRELIDLDCEIRVGKRVWVKTRLADLTASGFQVTFLDMPPRGTPIYVRFAGMQMQQAEVCWSKMDTAGCRFVTPLSSYVFNHIITNCR